MILCHLRCHKNHKSSFGPGAAALLDIREVQEERVHARARLHRLELGYCVVVAAVELAVGVRCVWACLRVDIVTDGAARRQYTEAHGPIK